MTIHYECTEDDIVALQLYFNQLPQGKKQQRALRGLVVLLMVLALLGVLGLISTLNGTPVPSLALPAAALYGAVAFVMLLMKNRSNVVQNVKKNSAKGYYKAILGKQETRLTPEGIFCSTSIGEGVNRWSAVEQVAETESHIYLHFSPVLFFLIPKRAFATPQQGMAFLQQIEQYRTGATGQPIPQTTRGQWWTQVRSEQAEDLQSVGRQA